MMIEGGKARTTILSAKKRTYNMAMTKRNVNINIRTEEMRAQDND